MRTVVYNFFGSSISPISEALCLRTSVLIAEHTYCSGSGYSLIDWVNFCKPLNIQMQLHMIDSLVKMIGDEPFENIQEQIDAIKAYKKIKHPKKEGIVMYETLKRNLDKYFEILKAEAAEKMQPIGMIGLEPLLDEDFFHTQFVEMHRPEFKSDKEELTAVSDMLLFEKEDYKYCEDAVDENESILILPFEFLTPSRPLNEEEIGIKSTYTPPDIATVPCYSFPNLLFASANDLIVIRKNLLPEITAFRKAMNQFLKNYNGGETLKEIDFKNDILPLCLDIQKKIDADNILNNFYQLQNNKITYELHFAFVSYSDIWKFYKVTGALPDESMKKINERLKKSPEDLIPVFIFQILDNGKSLTAAIFDNALKPIKKYLDLG